MDPAAMACGVIVGALLFAVAIALSRVFSRTDPAGLIVGSIAHVAVSIPENGIGLIALVVGSRRTTLPARCSDGRSISRGTEVVVADVRGRVAVVSQLY
jgi:hypothetical protein